ncbi:MAG: acyl-CoA thioesterase [Bacteroidetes bacterium]|nr:acyl-CoA thioesterase [Bacteroidota bacterium]
MIQFQDYRHIIPIQLRFADTDKLNHVNNANYATFIELGRVHYLNKILGRINWSETGFILARIELDFHIPIQLQDEIYCCTKTMRIGNKSITTKTALVKKVNNDLIEVATGISVLVAMDYVNNVSIPLPDLWRKSFEEFEK